MGSSIKKIYNFDTITDWFYFGPRAVTRFDIRTGDVGTPDPTWEDWQEAFDNEEYNHDLRRYVQHRLYAWIPSDVRASRASAVTPQFIYRSFVLRWHGQRYLYQYTTRNEYYTDGLNHWWSYTYTASGQYQHANWHHTETTAIEADILPIYLVP